MNKVQKKRVIRHAEHILVALPSVDKDPALEIALGAMQVLLDHTVGLATTVHLVRRLNELSAKAILLDMNRAGSQ